MLARSTITDIVLKSCQLLVEVYIDFFLIFLFTCISVFVMLSAVNVSVWHATENSVLLYHQKNIEWNLRPTYSYLVLRVKRSKLVVQKSGVRMQG